MFLHLILLLVLGSRGVIAESSEGGAETTVIALNNGNSYFAVNGQQRFLFGRNPTGDEQGQFDMNRTGYFGDS